MDKNISQEMLKMFENKIRAMTGQQAAEDCGFDNSEHKSNNEAEREQNEKAIKRKKAAELFESLGKHRYPRVYVMNNLIKLSKKLPLDEL